MKTVAWLVVFLCVAVLDIHAHSFKTMTAISYNTALTNAPLAPNIPNNREQRLQKLIHALQGSKADLICLQEVWRAEDVAAIVDGLRIKYPYSFSKIHDSMGNVVTTPTATDEAGCSSALSELVTCLQGNGCLVLSMEMALTQCANASCPVELGGFLYSSTESCLLCAFNKFPDYNLAESSCRDQSLRENTPGLVLLSKKRLLNQEYVEFFPMVAELITRGYLKATVGNKLEAVCTQLSKPSDLYPEINLFSQFNSYEEQNEFEAFSLVNEFGTTPKVLLLGDFSTGQRGRDGIQPLFPASFSQLSQAFYTRTAGKCTICPQEINLYNEEDDNYVVDHAFVNGLVVKSVKRVFTQWQLAVSSPVGQLPLSTNYGVKVVLKVPCNE